MKVLRYRIRLRQALLVAGRGGDPNTVRGLPYLPGATLRGALIGRYARGGALDITDPATRRLFFDGQCRFLNAYPVDHRDRRSLPTPLSWRRPKGETNPIRDFAVTEPPGSDWQALRAPFCVADPEDEDPTVYTITPERQTNLHTRRDRKAGRALADEGDIYSYDSLAPDQTFAGRVLCDTEADAAALEPLLRGTYRLGLASGTYGEVELIPDQSIAAARWRELPDERADDGPDLACDDNRLSVTLLSDTLVRDGQGRARVDAEALSEALARALKLGQVPTPEAAFFGADLRTGFNRTWGLPLPQEAVLTKGSVFVFSLDGSAPTEEALAALEWAGIGALRAEGFGRILCNWHQEENWTWREMPGSSGDSPPAMTSAAGQALAALMTRRMCDSVLDRALVQRVLTPGTGLRLDRPPPGSQLARLRRLIQNELLKESPDPGCLNGFLQELRGPARKHLERGRIDGRTLEDWLKWIAKPPPDGPNAIEYLKLADVSLPGVGANAGTLDEETRRRALLRLVDLVLAHAAKQQRGEGAR